jgi:phosphatidate phosphatase PAH1
MVMLRLSTEKLHVVFKDNVKADGPIVPRCYTLTHSDFTGDLFLSIGASYDLKQISGIYTKLMRDEVLAE